jgi:hypothetical protein
MHRIRFDGKERRNDITLLFPLAYMRLSSTQRFALTWLMISSVNAIYDNSIVVSAA